MLVAALVLGAASFAALGVGLAGVIRSAEGGAPAVNAIYLPMSFLSGSFFPATAFPELLQRIGDVLPLTYLIRLVRDIALRGEPIWEQPVELAIVAAWGLAGLILAIRRFRWEPSQG